MTPGDILRLRLENQRIARSSFRKPEDVVTWFGAMQGQDYLGSLWAVGQRVKAATQATVESAEARRAIIRTWPPSKTRKQRSTAHGLHWRTKCSRVPPKWWGARPSSSRRNASSQDVAHASLLPAFDEYTVAYADRSMLLGNSQQRSRMTLLNPAVLIDGRGIGTWKRTIDKQSVSVRTRPWRKLNRAERAALQDAAHRFAAFLGLSGKLQT